MPTRTTSNEQRCLAKGYTNNEQPTTSNEQRATIIKQRISGKVFASLREIAAITVKALGSFLRQQETNNTPSPSV